jgi:hypothetical protein
MKGKVNCTCGWSWNKSDSSAKDMYVCHQCGRDNSNNMKNGGWLDNYGTQANYNDSKATASPDMRGDGFSNVGRNYSPAWGGQFQEGGEIPMAQKGKKVKPIYVESKDDPRYKAFQDSLRLYKVKENKFIEDKNFLNTYAGIENAGRGVLDKVRGNKMIVTEKTQPLEKGWKDAINPIGRRVVRTSGLDDNKDIIYRDVYYKKPQQEVIVKPTTRFVPAQNWVDPITGISYTEKPFEQPVPQKRQPVKALQNNLKPKGLIQSDIEFNADMSGLRPQVRQPKYYDIQENINQPFGGSQTNYRTSDLNSITSPDDLGPGNTRKIVPHYAMGGSIPGSVGFTYARTKGIPSEGPYAKKTLPSAQNGVDMYGNPITADLKYDQSVNRTNYNPRTNQMIFGNDMPYFVSQEKIDKTLAHENRHAWQFANDRTNFNIVHNPEYAFQDRLKKKPEHPSTEEVFENYHNRKRREVEIDVKNFKSNYPELSFMPDSLIYQKFVDPLQYNNPKSVEGEAQFYQETGHQFQNGGEMKYYQNGLDFKPKSISRDGGWLNKYDQAQEGTKVKFDPKKFAADKKRNTPLQQSINKESNSEDYRRWTDSKEYKDAVKAEKIANDKAILADRKNRINKSVAAQKKSFTKDNWRQQLADETQATGDKLRIFPEDPDSFIDEWLNPGVMIGNMATDLGSAPLRAQQENSYMPYVTSIGVPLLTGGLEGIGAKTTGQFVSNIANPFNIVPGYKSVEKAIAPKIKKTLAKGVLPILEGAQSVKNKVYNKAFDLASSYRANNKNIMQKAIEDVNAGNAWSREWYSNPQIQNRYDEWITPANKFIDPKTALFHSNIENMYPGMSSINLDKSIGNRLSGTVARNNLEKLITEGGFTKPVTSFGSEKGMLGRYSHTPNDALVNIAHPGFNKRIFGKGFDVGNTVVHENIHALTKGDYGFKPEYLQKFKEPFKGVTGLTKHQKYLIKPTEVHARIGELRRTFNLTPETVVDDKLMDHIINQGLKGKTSVQKDFFKLIKDKNSFKQLMNTAPAGVVGVGLGANALQQQKEGGVIKDDRGQWEHPGEITEIGSNQITMEGVPYNVLGISDTGDTKLMKPGKNYKFKGKKVTEFPMAKNGRRQEQKGLQNLEDLTNFTNFNKPSNWLNKYN